MANLYVVLFGAISSVSVIMPYHAPVGCTFSAKPQLPVDQRPIPRHVLDHHHRFPTVLNNLRIAAQLDSLSVPLQLQEFKLLIREAARITRDEILASVADPGTKQLITLASISRAVWHGDKRLARILVNRSALARNHVEFTPGKVVLKRPDEFSSLYDAARADALERRKSAVFSNRSAINRLAKLWTPFGKRLVIHGIRVDGRVATSESSQLDALSSVWERTFSQKTKIDSKLATSIASKFASKCDLDSFASDSDTSRARS